MIDINRPKPLRLQIIIALQELLEQISEVDGDAFTLAGKVYRNRILFGEDVTGPGEVPVLSIIEAPRPDFATFAGEDNQARTDHWTLLIQGLAADDRMDTTDDVFFLCQDVERRLNRIGASKASGSPMFPEVHLLGGKITTIEIAPPVIRPPEAKVSLNSFFYIPVRLGVAMKIGE